MNQIVYNYLKSANIGLEHPFREHSRQILIAFWFHTINLIKNPPKTLSGYDFSLKHFIHV